MLKKIVESNAQLFKIMLSMFLQDSDKIKENTQYTPI